MVYQHAKSTRLILSAKQVQTTRSGASKSNRTASRISRRRWISIRLGRIVEFSRSHGVWCSVRVAPGDFGTVNWEVIRRYGDDSESGNACRVNPDQPLETLEHHRSIGARWSFERFVILRYQSGLDPLHFRDRECTLSRESIWLCFGDFSRICYTVYKHISRHECNDYLDKVWKCTRSRTQLILFLNKIVIYRTFIYETVELEGKSYFQVYGTIRYNRWNKLNNILIIIYLL